MHVVRGFYHRSPARAARYVQYSHREEGLPRTGRRAWPRFSMPIGGGRDAFCRCTR